MKKDNKQKLILAIETSCDETSVAVLSGNKILSNMVHSQLDLHAKYGGVVPSVARLAHQEKFEDVLESALDQAEVTLDQIDLVAVTVGPGLAISLEVGITKAKNLAIQLGVPLVTINHMEGHLFSSFVDIQDADRIMQTPAMGLLVSGGHTEILLVNRVGEYKKIGQTLDDACGEAFDKAAVMMGLGYPGGPAISKAATTSSWEIEIINHSQGKKAVATSATSNTKEFELPLPMAISPSLDVSYSGLKTALKQLINQLGDESDHQNIRKTGQSSNLSNRQQANLSKLFEVAAIETLILKLEKAISAYPNIQQLWTGGGVTANRYLRRRLQETCAANDMELFLPELSLTGDNAAMIGSVCHFNQDLHKYNDPTEFDKIDRKPQLSIDTAPTS